MNRRRNLNRCLKRSLARHTTRMLGGVHRPPLPNYLAIACRSVKEVIRIHERLMPFMEEQTRIFEEHQFRQTIKAAIEKVYGPDSNSMN